ncbi:hypothetical protein GCM10023063_16510 [Arthrobacter methylotrophus]|uniref:Transposase n=1 Tax=Arthrobacter methylotrophus TaxID=121291 RepID=A0ABV5UPM7_9MICC
MGERKAVTKAIATRYARSGRAAKKTILDELCATTDWHRDHARKVLRLASACCGTAGFGAAPAPVQGTPDR